MKQERRIVIVGGNSPACCFPSCFPDGDDRMCGLRNALDSRSGSACGGRWINLALSRRGSKALEPAGRFPRDYTPIYSHVTFSDIPYNKALRFGETQAVVPDAFLCGVSSIDEVNWVDGVALVERLATDGRAGTETTR